MNQKDIEALSDQFTDKSTAYAIEKGILFLESMADMDSFYFYDDGFPRNQEIIQDADATLQTIRQLIIERGEMMELLNSVAFALDFVGMQDGYIDYDYVSAVKKDVKRLLKGETDENS